MAESGQHSTGLYYTPCLPEHSTSVTPGYATFNQPGFVVHDVNNQLSYISGFGMLPTSTAAGYAAYTAPMMASHYIPTALAAAAPHPQVVYDMTYQHQEMPSAEPKPTMEDALFYNRTNDCSYHNSFQKRPPERNKGMGKHFTANRNSLPPNVTHPLTSKENGPKFHQESQNNFYQQNGPRWNDRDRSHSSNHHQNYWDQEQRKYSPAVVNVKPRNWKESVPKQRHYNRVWRNSHQNNNTVPASEAANFQRDNAKSDIPKETDRQHTGVPAKEFSNQNFKQAHRNDYAVKKTNSFGSGTPAAASPGPPPAVNNHSQLNYRSNHDQFSSHNPSSSSQHRNSETEYRLRGEDASSSSSRDCTKSSEEWWGRSQRKNKYKYVSQERDVIPKNQKKPTREISENKNSSEAVALASNPDDENQRDSLSEQLRCRKYECMVCCCLVYPDNGIWSCSNCYNIFHLRCIKKWALSPAATCYTEENKKGWRCPVCQMVRKNIPNQYRCFCGKIESPQWNHYDTPHCCGEPCRKRRNENCPHLCTLLCHPGPCPPCSSNALRKCVCGKKSQVMKCGQSAFFQCTEPCGKPLSCKKHSCQKVCHTDSCLECEVIIKQNCYGGHTEKYLACQEDSTANESEEFSCGKPCKKLLSCGNHECQELCHNGDCPDCPLLPANVTHCPCGQTPLADQSRTLCTDPVTTCDKICDKVLPCGPADNHHHCQQKCHNGPCGPCKQVTFVRCRCRIFEKDFPCAEALKFSEESPFLCEKRCNKKRNCGKHKCSQPCCVRTVHDCERDCRNLLTCGRHRCERSCHRGNCPPCLIASFEELTCYCGAEVIHPPVPCGTKPPECSKLCTKPHACDHPVFHKCNNDDQCPLCTVLTSKMCMGGHEQRQNIPCHISDVSCGMPCNKVLPCVQHKCKKACHKGLCQAEGETCNQPCNNVRPACGHSCNVPCHPGSECPRVACKSQISVKCPCGYRSASIQCLLGDDNITTEFSKITLDDLKNMSLGNDVDITKFGRGAKSGRRQLDCNEECSIRERNRRMALALEIKNPDLSSKLGSPLYSQFLKDFVKQHPQIVASIEKSLSELVQNTKSIKQSYKSHSFPPMNKEQRKLVHELAEHYGCQTEAYDMEPNRNVVAIARKDKCWLPSVTLTATLQKDRKVPLPISHLLDDQERRSTSSKQGCVVLNKMSRNSSANTNTTTTTTTTPTPAAAAAASMAKPADKPIIDYFDMS